MLATAVEEMVPRAFLSLLRFNFLGIIRKEITFLISFLDRLLLVYRSTTDFYQLICSLQILRIYFSVLVALL